jgi:hypothetical protein
LLAHAFPQRPQWRAFVLGLTQAMPHLIAPFLHFFLDLRFFRLAPASSQPANVASAAATAVPSSDRRDGAARARVK